MPDLKPTETPLALLVCVDGSLYTDSVCAHAAWASGRLNAPIRLLHLQAPSSDSLPATDLSGALGLGAKSALLETLTQVDEARGKLDQQKGNLILAYAKEQLAGSEAGTEIAAIETLHRRGSLVETIVELEPSSQLIVLGKRGEHADFATRHLGSNLERVLRAAHKPVLVAARRFNPIGRFAIAYDGGPSTQKALAYLVSNPLLQGLECHVLKIGPDTSRNRQDLGRAVTTLQQGGYTVHSALRQGDADEEISAYAQSNQIDMLIMGAYGHSHIRTLVIGSTTSSILRSCLIPVLMFH